MPSWPGLTVFLVERDTSITMSPRSRAGSPSMRNPASNETISDSVELCETEVCFLHIQLMGTKGRLPKIHKTPTRSWFRVFKVTSKIRVLEWTQSTMLSRVTHMTILSAVTCVMNVWNQTSLSFVTSSCPSGDWSCQCVHRPQDVWSSNPCHVQACQDNLWANFW